MSTFLLPTYETLPLRIVRGKGVWLYDDVNKPYLDMYGGHAVALLGHSHPALVAAIYEQAQKLLFYSNIVPLAIREEAAERLAGILPETHRHLFFCNSGAEANENALKLAIKLTGRHQLVAFKGAFHGRTLLSGAVTDDKMWHQALGPWTGGRVTFLTPNVLSELETIQKTTAVVILEPIQSIGGVVAFEKPYLQALRQRCREMGALLIYDEVQTGMGRCGDAFFSQDVQIRPDMFTTAKGLASGFPIGALFVSQEIAQHIKIGDLGSTFGGGPLAMAALKATVEVILQQSLFAHVNALAQYVQEIFNIPDVLEIRGRGCLLGLKIHQPVSRLTERLLKRGVVVGASRDPQVIRLLPPLIIQKEHLDFFKNILLEELAS